MNTQLNEVLKLLETLPKSEKQTVAEALYRQLSHKEATSVRSFALTQVPITACHHCGSVRFVKNGKDRRGLTRYLCRDCGKTFGDNTDTAISGTRKSPETWKTYIASMLDGCSLVASAERCGLSVPTAFVWRHKIFSALSEQAFPEKMNGVIEMDEMFVRVSYKGNHKKSHDFVMPRKPHRRGTDGHDTSNHTKATVVCMVERNQRFSGVIPCRGFVNAPLLEGMFARRLSEETIMLTDGLYAYRQYFQTTNIEHVILPLQTGHRPTVKGAFHINNVNALHGRFRHFLSKYNGVSTKYLGNYLAFFLWLENHREGDRQHQLCEELSKAGAYTTVFSLRQAPPAPELAPAPAA